MSGETLGPCQILPALLYHSLVAVRMDPGYTFILGVPEHIERSYQRPAVAAEAPTVTRRKDENKRFPAARSSKKALLLANPTLYYFCAIAPLPLHLADSVAATGAFVCPQGFDTTLPFFIIAGVPQKVQT